MTNPSDHTPISVGVEVDARDDDSISVNASYDILADHPTCNIRKPKRIKDNVIDWNSYTDIAEHDFHNYAQHLDNLNREKTLVNVDIAVDSLSKSLYRVALTLTPKHRAANYATDHENNSLLHREDLQCSIETWESLRHDVVTFLKNEITKKERHTWNTLKKEKNSKALWNKIIWRGTLGHIPVKNKPTFNGKVNQMLQVINVSTCLTKKYLWMKSKLRGSPLNRIKQLVMDGQREC